MFNKIKRFLHNLFCKPTKITPPPAENQTRRNEDLSAESQLAIFMDRYLYDRFPTGSSFSSIRRVYDKQEQLKGIDVEFIGTDGRVYNVDEKAQLYYLNQNLPTFAFELLSFQKGYDTIGWLCNSNLKTDLYMLIWPFASTDKSKGIRWEQFSKVDCLLIQKQKVLKLLADKGLTPDRLITDAKRIRASGKTGRISIQGVHGIYYFASSSQYYKEAPINVIISKPLLQGIASRRYIVTPDDVITE